MPIQVLFFSFAADRMKTRHLSVDVPEGATVGDVFNLFRDRLQAPAVHFAFAVNDEWAPSDRALKPGDVLAVIPPVAGG